MSICLSLELCKWHSAHISYMRAFIFSTILLAIFAVSDEKAEDNKDDMEYVLGGLRKSNRKSNFDEKDTLRQYALCLWNVEFQLIGFLNATDANEKYKWTKCRNEFGTTIEDLRQYSGKKKFECPKIPEPEQSFVEKSVAFVNNNWMAITGAGVAMAALPGISDQFTFYIYVKY